MDLKKLLPVLGLVFILTLITSTVFSIGTETITTAHFSANSVFFNSVPISEIKTS